MFAFHAARRSMAVTIPFVLLASLLLVLADPLALTAAESGDAVHSAAAVAVREALQREIYGSAAARRELLDEAVDSEPEYAPARWQLGYVKDAKRGWLAHNEFLKTPKVAAALARYERQRTATPDTV